jgi:hypothetical protein
MAYLHLAARLFCNFNSATAYVQRAARIARDGGDLSS